MLTNSSILPPASLRRLRLQQFGGWLFVFGITAAFIVVAGLFASGLTLPFRMEGLTRQPTTMLALFTAAALAALLATTGLALFLGVPGTDPLLARRGFDSPITVLACLAAVGVIGNLLPLPLFFSPEMVDSMRQSTQVGTPPRLPVGVVIVALIATQIGLMSVLVWRIVRPGVITWDAMGLNTEHLGRRIVQGLVGGVSIFLGAGAVGLALRQLGIEQTQSEMFAGMANVSTAQFIGLFLAASIVAPICEECFFRGYVFAALRGRYGRLLAYGGSAFVFGVIHFNLPAMVPIILMALGLAFLYDRSGSVVPGIIAHGFNNALALLALYVVVNQGRM